MIKNKKSKILSLMLALMLLPAFTPAVLAADSDIVSWLTSPAANSFGDPSATSTAYTTPAAPRCDVTPMATLAKVDLIGTVRGKVLTAVITGTMAKDALAAEKNTGEGIAIQFNVTGNEDHVSLSATLGRKAMEAFKAADVKYVQIASAVINLSLDLEAITEILDQTTGNIIISSVFQDKLSDEAKLLIGSRPVFDITAKDCKGTIVSDLKDGIITIGIAYKLDIDEKSVNLYGVYMDSKGKPQPLTNTTYDNGMVIFGISIPSTYGVGYKTAAPLFTDITSHWAKDDIDFIAGQEIFTSTNAAAFSPDTPITRAMFVTALGRLSDADISGDTTGSFSDIPADSYYLPYVEWAVANNIISGTGEGKFSPNNSIIREDMAVMMQNYAKATGYTIPASHEVIAFGDDAQISPDTKDAVKTIQQAGIIIGRNNNQFAPKAEVTRAEASTILHRFVEFIIDEKASGV